MTSFIQVKVKKTNRMTEPWACRGPLPQDRSRPGSCSVLFDNDGWHEALSIVRVLLWCRYLPDSRWGPDVSSFWTNNETKLRATAWGHTGQVVLLDSMSHQCHILTEAKEGACEQKPDSTWTLSSAWNTRDKQLTCGKATHTRALRCARTHPFPGQYLQHLPRTLFFFFFF